MSDDPIAYFITWTVYGTFLQGDERWWSQRRKGKIAPEPRLERFHRSRLKHDVILLTPLQRNLVEAEVERLCNFRNWHVRSNNPRSNHVHVVVGAPGVSGAKVRDQLKANCTRVLRENHPIFVGRPVWTVGGDWKSINSEEELMQVILYVDEAQDRKDRDA